MGVNLVASLIVKNELGRYLEPCVEHLQTFCDDITAVDDGSTDGTYEYLQSAGCVVTQLPASDGFFDGHEGRRRQFLLEWTVEQTRPEWLLAIDADEFISDGAVLRAFCSRPRQVANLNMKEVWKAGAELSVRVDGGWRPHPCPIMYRPPARLTGRWRIADRALACGREPQIIRSMMGRSRPSGVDILHFGWANQAARKARYDRYVTADGGRYHRNSHLDSIMWPDLDVTLEAEPWPVAVEPWREAILRAAA